MRETEKRQMLWLPPFSSSSSPSPYLSHLTTFYSRGTFAKNFSWPRKNRCWNSRRCGCFCQSHSASKELRFAFKDGLDESVESCWRRIPTSSSLVISKGKIDSWHEIDKELQRMARELQTRARFRNTVPTPSPSPHSRPPPLLSSFFVA